MGVLELIQQKSFLGKEFLTWLWFRAERDGHVEMSKEEPLKVEVLGPILLDAQYGDARASALKGDSPATAPEARTALLEGKKLKKAKFKWTRAEMEWIFTIDGENFNLSGLNVPNPGKLPFDETMAFRAETILEFERILQQLLETFLQLRLDAKAWAREIPAIQEWVRTK